MTRCVGGEASGYAPGMSDNDDEAVRPPTPEEEAAAERADAHPERTKEPYQEMTDIGAEQQGEGRPGV